MPEHDAIVLDGISKTFRRAKAPSVYETHLKVESGKFVTILGTSGCGKTTLLKMVNRLYEPSSGRILINNEDVTDIPPTVLRRRIGYVIQQIGLFQHMTIEQNVATVPKILGWDKARISSRIDELLNLVRLDPALYRKRYPRQLSGGQQQRVGIARAMAADPSIMLMDEPFGAIDAINRTMLQDEILKIQKQLHKTILFVTHDIMEALKLGDKVIIMNDGTIQQYDEPLKILRHPANDFVRHLVNSDDILKSLSFIKAKDVMNPEEAGADPGDDPVLHEDDSLKEVLIALLREKSDEVRIIGQANKVTGKITFQDLKKI
ncbi:ABC transporter ATP-binding protein [Sporolactobacillus sp. Y61]|uniref:Carnitine transport ATP-binding protein OpuCA n=1 Tax=Sporolactobacillus sp. Y61 TaxID=3160863 RepID=A0AAU8II31_9BACL